VPLPPTAFPLPGNPREQHLIHDTEEEPPGNPLDLGYPTTATLLGEVIANEPTGPAAGTGVQAQVPAGQLAAQDTVQAQEAPANIWVRTEPVYLGGTTRFSFTGAGGSPQVMEIEPTVILVPAELKRPVTITVLHPTVEWRGATWEMQRDWEVAPGDPWTWPSQLLEDVGLSITVGESEFPITLAARFEIISDPGTPVQVRVGAWYGGHLERLPGLVAITRDDGTTVQPPSADAGLWTVPYDEPVQATVPRLVIRKTGPKQFERYIFDHWEVVGPYDQSDEERVDPPRTPTLSWYPQPGANLTAYYRQDHRPLDLWWLDVHTNGWPAVIP
jgi:hypothetical protein